MKTLAALSLALLATLLAGCHPRSTATAPGGPLAQPPSGAHQFAVRGIIREIPAGGRTLVVLHDEITGYMPRMVMGLTVRNPDELQGLAVGDEIEFQLNTTDAEHWIERIHRTGSHPVGDLAATPHGSVPAATYLKVGEEMPDAEMVSESGARIRLSDFRGKAVALTFVFTRCPLPDFCPRMNRNFTRARELLRQQADLTSRWQLLSVSFDPGFDRPEVLQRYARGYRGTNSEGWLFAAASEEMLSLVAPRLDFMMSREEGTFSHNLRTVVIDTAGRIARQFDGNTWTAEELAAAMREATGEAPAPRPGMEAGALLPRARLVGSPK
ncbi:MAG TPA: hypothetical protein DCM86_08220 [Verrucomicrobiales bacterium]|nr:hypothetical protein [Verrucomicrobiales bacterium]